MIKNEAKIRIVLQAVLAAALAHAGYWGFALATFLILLPWKPVLAAGGYLAQPLVDWWIERGRPRRQNETAQVERELDVTLRPLERGVNVPARAAVAAIPSPKTSPRSPLPQSQRTFRSAAVKRPSRPNLVDDAQNLSATLAISPAIRHHVENSPQDVLTNMDLEIEGVNIHGDTADATVRFQSPNVTGLVIRQMYVLRKSGDEWQVEIRQGAMDAGLAPSPPPTTGHTPLRLS